MGGDAVTDLRYRGLGSCVLHLFVSAQDGHKSESYLQQQRDCGFGSMAMYRVVI